MAIVILNIAVIDAPMVNSGIQLIIKHKLTNRRLQTLVRNFIAGLLLLKKELICIDLRILLIIHYSKKDEQINGIGQSEQKESSK
jgi:hypothetical protein